ncbi:hypothetical protein PVK06_047338 [Gossypium arboreum]|uniref:Retrovirus-related Pol polyprotein from transposon TNT 1-94 n=1 Tax=Gossypium arboreum TaxID=29729 RepID=A0ABR0MDE7_GOSAR|nr:hypothetical protein PVK06_047338 [Gossypium arboreum]
MAPTHLLNILTDKLKGNNYNEWKKNLIIFLSCEKLKTILDTKLPPTTQTETRKCWEVFDEIGHCYMLASMNNTLYKQLESCKTDKAILYKLEDMFGGQASLARQSIITSLINAQQKPNTPVKDHMITLMGYLPRSQTMRPSWTKTPKLR